MTIDDIIEYFGSAAEFESQTGFSHSCFWHWRRRNGALKGRVPYVVQRWLYHYSNGKLKPSPDDELLELNAMRKLPTR